jgi:hypothetical protein
LCKNKKIFFRLLLRTARELALGDLSQKQKKEGKRQKIKIFISPLSQSREGKREKKGKKVDKNRP